MKTLAELNVSATADLRLDLLCNPAYEAYEVIAARVSGHWFPRGRGNKARKRAKARSLAIIRDSAPAWGRIPFAFHRLNRYAHTGRG